MPEKYKKPWHFRKSLQHLSLVMENNAYIAHEHVVIPVVLGKKLYKLLVDVVDNELLLLNIQKELNQAVVISIPSLYFSVITFFVGTTS